MKKKFCDGLIQMNFYTNLSRKTNQMGLIKPNNYSYDELKFTTISKSIGHPARDRIIELLIEGKFVRNVDLSEYLNLSQAMVTKHLDSLKQAELIGCMYEVHYDVLYLQEETLDYYYDQLQKKIERLKTRRY